MSAAPNPTEAAEALAAVHASRAQLLSRRSSSAWLWQTAGAAILSGFVAANSAWWPVTLAIDAALVLLTFAMVAAGRRLYGVFVNGWRAGPMRPVAAGVTLLYLATAGISLWFKLARGVEWAPLAGGAVLFPLALIGYRMWQGAFRRDVERGL